jgi:hypothetical protein
VSTDIELITEAEAAEFLGIGPIGVQQLIGDGSLVVLPIEGTRHGIPADFIQDGQVVKHLRAVITLLRDGRYTDAEVVDWLFREEESLPGSPIQALRENRGTEVKRRAQAAGF